MRRRKAQEKVILPDPKFNSVIISKFINMVMVEGKKSVAEKMVYGSFEVVKKQLNDQDIIKIFNKALDNARPRLEVKPRRVGGATYQVPIEVRQERGTSIALRWIRDFARTKKSAANASSPFPRCAASRHSERGSRCPRETWRSASALSPSRASRVITSVSEKGLLSESLDPEDRRAVSITLTASGEDMKKLIEKKKNECEKRLLAKFAASRSARCARGWTCSWRP